MKKGISFITTLALILTLLLGINTSYITTASSQIFNDNYSGATSSNLFTTSYKTLPNDVSKPMYIRTGGSISAGSNSVTLSGGRMTIGALSGSSTSSSSTPGGVFDLSQDYRIIINVANTSGNSSKNFQVYVDNNTTSQGNSIHGGASKVYEESIGNISSGNIVIEPNVGTSNSFIQVRTESDVNVTINEITIEYLDDSAPPTDPPPVDPPTDPMDIIYVEPNAPSNGEGTLNNPMAFVEALNHVAPGGVIYMRGGSYHYDHQVTIEYGNNGQEGAMKSIIAYNNEKPILDFSSQPYNSSTPSVNPRGLQLDGNYWHIVDVEFYGSADNGLFISGNNNIIERCIANANRDTGIQLGRRNSSLDHINDWPSHNLILNTTAFNNADPDNYGDADGFAAKLTIGEGNVFDGCIAYNNVDDGWDLFTKTDTGPIGSVIIRNSVAFNNGETTDGRFSGNSSGNGFKLGGSNMAVDHLVENSVAFNNKAHGFTDNSNPGQITLINCTSFNNSTDKPRSKSNFDLARHSSSNNIFINLLSYAEEDDTIASDKFRGTGISNVFFNSHRYYRIDEEMYIDSNSGVTRGTEIPKPDPSEFKSLTPPISDLYNIHETLRNSDGTINMGDFLELSNDSQFKGIGVDGQDLGATFN
ncbi:parallel beta helix pectate lyase-like protein [Natranaerovirga hydrolytica]|uniref:Parallel beta helix pectate lyase-like protein n=1 Tax=Natranaerovirga hydrolytica TaxID=680378 RepID=A0A4R1MJ94_9FIRM|nr:right-handed parallel beta-helix repeat-containing protein [Natranaerovirga hydrolytica]TCK92848.1 parallel beta helix pectate lyase-like protein [Natranaerovirga hydrolytica]